MLLLAFNIFGVAVILAVLFAEDPLTFYTRCLLIALFILLPPLNLFAFFRREPGLFAKTFDAWFRLACPTREEKRNHRAR